MAGSSERAETIIPNRIFVGSLPPDATEEELLSIFQQYGNVTATNILTDRRSGMAKGYGFVTFVTAEEALQALQKAQGIVLRDKKLNVGQAIRKGSASSNGENQRAMIIPYASPVLGRENLCFQPTQVPMYYMQYPQQASYVPYVYPVSQENYDQADEDMKQYSKQSPASANGTPEYEVRSNPKPYPSNAAFRFSNGGSPILQQQLSYHHFVPKTGMTVMAYPSPFVMGSPAILHVKESTCDQESLMSELSYLHSPISSNALTPPSTPLTPMPLDFGASPNLEIARKN